MPAIEIRCPHCSASGRVDNESNSPFMMGRCPVCNGYVVYFCGTSLGLDDDAIDTHSLSVIRDHILCRIDEFLEARLTEFLEEYADEFQIAAGNNLTLDVNSDLYEEGLDAYHTTPAQPVPLMRPSSARCERGRITDAEVADFLRIDLNLIDRTSYFKQQFGS